MLHDLDAINVHGALYSTETFLCLGETIDPLHKWRLHLNNNTYTSLASHS